MGFLDRIEQRASKGAQVYLANPDRFALQLFGAHGNTASGIRVTSNSSLEWTPLAAAVRILSNTTAMIPLLVLEKEERGKNRLDDHALSSVLGVSPNPEQTAFEFRSLIPVHQILWGNFYAEVIRQNGFVRQLWPLNPDRVRMERRGSSVIYIITTADGPRTLRRDQVLHIPGFVTDGLVGRSLAKDHAEAIGLGLATEAYTSRFFGNDASPGGYLRHPEALSDEAFDRLKASWNAKHQGLDQSHRMAILEEGMEWQQVMADPAKADALGLKKFQVNEAVRIVTGVPPHLIGDFERATFNNSEEATQNFASFGVQPTCSRIEQRINTSLLTSGERDRGIFVEHQMQGLLRGSIESRSDFYQAMLDRGVFNINNVRAFENLNAIDMGDEHFVRMDMQTLDRAVNPPPVEPARAERHLRLVERSTPRTIAPTEVRRREVRESFDSLFLDAMGRITASEARRVRRAIKMLEAGDIAGFLEFLRSYYFEKLPGTIRRIILPLFIAYAEAMAKAAAEEIDSDVPDEEVKAFAERYTDSFANRYSGSSRKQLEDIVAEPGESEVADAVAQRVTDWEEGDRGRSRSELEAERQSRTFGNLVARTVFVAAGATRLVSRAIGDSCPYCLALDGKRVLAPQPFLNEGELFKPEGADRPLTVPRALFAPPYHKGCDCEIDFEL